MISNFDDRMKTSPLMMMYYRNLKAKWGGVKTEH